MAQKGKCKEPRLPTHRLVDEKKCLFSDDLATLRTVSSIFIFLAGLSIHPCVLCVHARLPLKVGRDYRLPAKSRPQKKKKGCRSVKRQERTNERER